MTNDDYNTNHDMTISYVKLHRLEQVGIYLLCAVFTHGQMFRFITPSNL